MNRALAVTALAVASTIALPRPTPAQVSIEANVVPAFESISPEGSAKESRGTIDGGLDA